MVSALAPVVSASRTREVVRLVVGVLIVNAIAWGLLFGLFVPALGTGVGVALGVTAFVLGVRHGLDADHIAAIDNVTRRLIARNTSATSVGWWFALGHSTVVVAATVLVAAGFGALVGDGATGFGAVAGVWGPAFSGMFLLTIAAVNTIVLVRAARGGGGHAAPHGIFARIASQRALTRPWHMYGVGLLFGLGLDTAASVAVIVAAALSAAQSVSLVAVAALPLLFLGGMLLIDTTDGAVMSRAYVWSRALEGRRRRYDLIVTGTTVVFGAIIGTLQLTAAIRAGSSAAGLGFVDSLDFGILGLGGIAVLGIVVTAVAVRSRAVLPGK